LRIYLETSAINFLFADDAPDKKAATEKLFQEIKIGKHKAFISSVVAKEIARAPYAKKTLLEGVIEEYNFPMWEIDERVVDLTRRYMEGEIFPQRYEADALQVAVAVVNRCDVLVSWNFNHIVKAKTIIRVGEINRRLGLPDMVICTPEEVIEYDERV
jgi:predicted nucleic acid-binding protein